VPYAEAVPSGLGLSGSSLGGHAFFALGETRSTRLLRLDCDVREPIGCRPIILIENLQVSHRRAPMPSEAPPAVVIVRTDNTDNPTQPTDPCRLRSPAAPGRSGSLRRSSRILGKS
jgi:hypothetical protein